MYDLSKETKTLTPNGVTCHPNHPLPGYGPEFLLLSPFPLLITYMYMYFLSLSVSLSLSTSSRHPTVGVITPSLRAIGNILTGDDVQTQFVINCSALPALQLLLDHPVSSIRKEACWAISNMTAGNKVQIQVREMGEREREGGRERALMGK